MERLRKPVADQIVPSTATIKIAYRAGMIRQVTPGFDDLECAATQRGLSPLAPLE